MLSYVFTDGRKGPDHSRKGPGPLETTFKAEAEQIGRGLYSPELQIKILYLYSLHGLHDLHGRDTLIRVPKI